MIVLITGASGGIGSAAAKLFVEGGHEVHGLDVQPASESLARQDKVVGSEAAAADQTGGLGRYIHHIGDVRDPETFPKGLEPEVLVNCAGVQNSENDIEVNLKGTVNITEKYAIQNEKCKSVVNVGSASAHTGSEFPEYAASKGGVMAYTKNVALRLAPRGICNSIDAGGVRTELNSIVMDDPALWDQIIELTPLKRWATPEEIAEWIYFVGITNRFMTGQCLLIDGGEAGNAKFVWKD